MVSVWGAGLVGVHLAPRGEAHDIADSNPAETFGYAVSELSRRGIAFLCVRESLTGHRFGPALRAAFRGSYIANEGLTQESAQGLLAAGEADAVAFGKLFIANPDLPQRLRANLPLNAWQSETFYSSGPEGYTDYPAAQTAAE